MPGAELVARTFRPGQLGQSEVEAWPRGGAGAHGAAKAGLPWLGAIHRDDERHGPPLGVCAARVHPVAEHAVLDEDRAEIARSHTEKRVPRHVLIGRPRLEKCAIALGRPPL